MSRSALPDGWDDYARQIGFRLQRHRHALGMTQEDVAYAADLTRSHYQQLEKGLSRPGVPANPSLLTLTSLARVLGISVGELLTEAEST